MAEIIEGVKVVELDKSKKYVVLCDESLGIGDASKIMAEIKAWLNEKDNPVVMLYGSGIRLLEVEEDE